MTKEKENDIKRERESGANRITYNVKSHKKQQRTLKSFYSRYLLLENKI